MPAQPDRPDRATHYVVRAAVTAPSLHNSQPWLFGGRDGDILLHADLTRRLPYTDPNGRELIVSCGAALFNLRLAMRHLGFRPVVHLLPTPRLPRLLARVSWGAYSRITADEELLFRAMRERRTHRGPFQPTPLPAPLIEALRLQALAEGAELYTVVDSAQQRRLAAVVRRAESFQRSDPDCAAELTGWTQPNRTCRYDGVPAEASPFHPDSTLLAGRDFTGWSRHSCGVDPAWTLPTRTGLVALLNTARDTPQDWLRAGQALQRVLLYATAHTVNAGFHTQPLEIPPMRADIRTMIPSRQFPQMILRLGHTNWKWRTPRRPVRDVFMADALSSAYAPDL
ncbi:Acg family FMN-binding oxidoreductase [Streptomyces venezuelae]|uniref:Acg family FMN-binding oxidoreductase n=1 Tax=Streptomyces venezuelae TaxID=54571 RepID=UPI003791B2ED